MDVECLLPCSQQPATCPYRRIIQSPHYHPICLRSTSLLFYHVFLDLPSRLFPSVSPPDPSSLPYETYFLPISPSPIWIPKWWRSSLCSFLQSRVTCSLSDQNNFSVPYCGTPAAYSLSLMWEGVHAHTKQLAELRLFCILVFTFLYGKREDKTSGPNASRHSL